MANEEQSTNSEIQVEDHTDYDPFIKATKEGDWSTMEEFIESHPQALTAKLCFAGREDYTSYARRQRTALHYALDKGLEKIAVSLVDRMTAESLEIQDQDGFTALHYALNKGLEKIAVSLVDRMTAESLEIQDQDGFTALAIGANRNYPGQLDLLKLMHAKNSKLASIGNSETIPVVLASGKRFEDTTHYLYSITEKNILSPENGTAGVRLLNNCIELKMFDIALELVEKFPEILKVEVKVNRYKDIKPIATFATTFSTLQSVVGHKKSRRIRKWLSNIGAYVYRGDEKITEAVKAEELIYDQARAFLLLVCAEVSTFDIPTLREYVYHAMTETAKNGNIEFINEMLSANPELIWARTDHGFYFGSATMFVYAIIKRHDKVFNLIYGALEHKDELLSIEGRCDRVLHLAAMLPPKFTLDRISKSPALQIQRELQWFKEVRKLTKPQYREDINRDRLTPREEFDKSHEILINSGEKLMKDTAQSCTTVGAFIVSIMFAAAFTVPGGNSQDTGYPLFVSDELFKIFISCDALSLSSSTASILIFLEILTSSYVEEDFLLYLPFYLYSNHDAHILLCHSHHVWWAVTVHFAYCIARFFSRCSLFVFHIFSRLSALYVHIRTKYLRQKY